ncbi:MAG: hypothetical protein WC718_12835 [Phycisphaerales bacterium]|jgi:hypothetical protein
MSIAVYDDLDLEGLGDFGLGVQGQTTSLLTTGLVMGGTSPVASAAGCPAGEQPYDVYQGGVKIQGGRCFTAAEAAAMKNPNLGTQVVLQGASPTSFYQAPVPTGWATGAGLQWNPALQQPLVIPGVNAPGVYPQAVPQVSPGVAPARPSFLQQYQTPLIISGLVIAALVATMVVMKATKKPVGVARGNVAGLAGAGKQRFYRTYGADRPLSRREANMLKRHWFV